MGVPYIDTTVQKEHCKHAMYLGVCGVEVTEHAACLQHRQHAEGTLETHFICMEKQSRVTC